LGWRSKSIVRWVSECGCGRILDWWFLKADHCCPLFPHMHFADVITVVSPACSSRLNRSINCRTSRLVCSCSWVRSSQNWRKFGHKNEVISCDLAMENFFVQNYASAIFFNSVSTCELNANTLISECWFHW
jgi:hypothetical protein